MVYNKQREGHVSDLCEAGVKCGVARVKSNASAEAVKKCVESIRASQGPQGAKDDAEAAFAKHRATFKPQGSIEPPPQPEGDQKQFRLRGTSFLLNYNWDCREFMSHSQHSNMICEVVRRCI